MILKSDKMNKKIRNQIKKHSEIQYNIIFFLIVISLFVVNIHIIMNAPTYVWILPAALTVAMLEVLATAYTSKEYVLQLSLIALALIISLVFIW